MFEWHHRLNGHGFGRTPGVCVGNKQIILSFFQFAPKYCILDIFVDYEDYSISFKGSLPIVVDIMVI